jgi:Probable zinc-ribbon domain
MKDEDRIRLRKERLARLRQDRPRRIGLLIERGWIRDASDIPEEMIPIDVEESTKAKLFWPEVAYADIEFKCRSCGRLDYWWADQQQAYFEQIKASPYQEPRLCFDCRLKEVERKEAARKAVGNKGKA